MTVAGLLQRLRDRIPTESDAGITQLLSGLDRFAVLPVSQFVEVLAKVKVPKPKKTDEEKQREKEEAARKKAEAAAAKRAATEEAKRAKAEEAARKKDETKRLAEEAKGQKKAQEEERKQAEADKAVNEVILELKAVEARFRNGNVPAEVVNAPLEKLKALKALQLLTVARALDAAATLTEKTPKAKILKVITEMIRRAWKTSDNVHH